MVQTYRAITVPSDSILADLAQTYSLFLKAYRRKDQIHIGISIFAELVFGLERWQIELSRTARRSAVIQSLNDDFVDESEDTKEASELLRKQAVRSLREIKESLQEVDAELGKIMREVLAVEVGVEICFCRSVDHGGRVVECSDERYQLRRFHAGCVGVAHFEPEALEGWMCPYCQGRGY